MLEPLAKFEDIVIPHSAFANALDEIEKAFLSTANQHGHVAVFGEYGTGKTCLLQEFRSMHAPIEGDQGTEIPVLFVPVPPGATIKSIAHRIITALKAPYVERSTLAASVQLVRAIRGAGTKLILLDDCQNLGDSGVERKTHHLLEWLIDLTAQTATRLVLSGPPSCSDFITRNERFARRIGRRIIFESFSWDDDDQRREFADILKSFDYELGKRLGISFLDSPETAFRIHCASGGVIGNVVRLLRDAVANAVTESRSTVSMNDFDAARSQFIEPKTKRTRSRDRFDSNVQPLLRVDGRSLCGKSRLSLDRYGVTRLAET